MPCACGFESHRPDKTYLYLKDCRMRVALMGSPQLCWKDSCARTEVRVLTDINNIQSEHMCSDFFVIFNSVILIVF